MNGRMNIQIKQTIFVIYDLINISKVLLFYSTKKPPQKEKEKKKKKQRIYIKNIYKKIK